MFRFWGLGLRFGAWFGQWLRAFGISVKRLNVVALICNSLTVSRFRLGAVGFMWHWGFELGVRVKV